MAPELVAFGDISVDVAVRVAALPGPDEKVWVEVLGEHPGGMGANAAAAFSALGGRSALVAAVGDDDRGGLAMKDLAARAVDTSHVAHVDGATFWTLALLTESGEKSLLQFRTPALAVPWDSVDWSALDGAAFAHTIADEGVANLRMIAEARARGVSTSIDIEPVDLASDLRDALLAGTDVVFGTPSGLSAIGAPAEPTASARWTLQRGPRIVAVTLGRDGCVVATADSIRRIPGMAVDAKDTTGAGDCFAGAFLFALARGRSPMEAGQLANSMAALSTTAFGSRGYLPDLATLAGRPELAALAIAEWRS